MDSIAQQLLAAVGDRTVIAIILSFTLTIGVLWRLVARQRAFIRKSLDLLRQENQEFRQGLQTEHEGVTSRFNEHREFIRDKLDLLRQEQQELRREFRATSEGVINLSGQVQTLGVTLRERASMSELNRQSTDQMLSSLKELQEVIVKQSVGRQATVELATLVESLAETAQDSSSRLADVAQRARVIIGQSAD